MPSSALAGATRWAAMAWCWSAPSRPAPRSRWGPHDPQAPGDRPRVSQGPADAADALFAERSHAERHRPAARPDRGLQLFQAVAWIAFARAAYSIRPLGPAGSAACTARFTRRRSDSVMALMMAVVGP